jgi:hypothetical protein
VLTKSLPSATHLHRGDSRESGRDTALGLEQRLPLNRINHDVAGLPISVRTHCGPWRRRLEPDLLKPTDRLAGRCGILRGGSCALVPSASSRPLHRDQCGRKSHAPAVKTSPTNAECPPRAAAARPIVSTERRGTRSAATSARVVRSLGSDPGSGPPLRQAGMPSTRESERSHPRASRPCDVARHGRGLLKRSVEREHAWTGKTGPVDRAIQRRDVSTPPWMGRLGRATATLSH